MIVNLVDLKGRVEKVEMERDAVICASLKELLLSHDSLYRDRFPCPPASPHWDIAAKNARRVYEALYKKKELPKMTIEVEFL